MKIGRPPFDYKTYLKQLQAVLPCQHLNAEPRRKLKKNTLEPYYRIQCPDCGAAISSNAVSYSVIADFETAFGKVKDWDVAKYNAYWAKRHFHGKIFSDLINNERDRIWWEKYDTYLASSEWQVRRLRILHRDSFTCQSCKKHPAVHVHHLTYDRCGEEADEDLTARCFACHKTDHPERHFGLEATVVGSDTLQLVAIASDDDEDLPW